MTQDQFNKAAEIINKSSEIEFNKFHIEEAKKEGNLRLFITNLNNKGDFPLFNEILPIPVETLIDMYLISADKKIIELEKEFEKL